MKALLFGTPGEGTTLPLDLVELDDPPLPGEGWVHLRTRLTGICGSDAKQILMDFGDGDPTDNAMTALISFPQVLGHEVVGTVDADGDGTRYVLNPWLSCTPRGIDPVCPACAAGDLNLCWNFTEGCLQPGIHVGNSADAPGGFGELVPAHRSMLHPIPDAITDEVAVLADPFSVALHAITRNPPGPDGRAVVYGAGALGLSAVAILRTLYPECEVLAVARFDTQRRLAEELGATVIGHEPLEAVVTDVADWSGATLRRPWTGLPFAHPGHVDVVYDTIGAPDTTEVGLRVVRARGTVVQLGVNPPGRFEWTPLYFKEVRIVGSNAFAIEKVEGIRQHGLAHYLDLVAAGRIDLSGMLTHTFALEQWREAFAAVADQRASGAIKVAFDLR
ncbi:MAG: zinc-binding dehydrogenase [Actinobacteria bacterium]|nr:zinc-binding dehydrogenase [Actinomycetota bacterium]